MAIPKFSSASSLSLIAVVLLVGGLVVAVIGSQQQQDQRSKAAGAAVGDQIVTNQTLPTNNTTGYTKTGLLVGAEYKIVINGTFKMNSDSSADPMVADAQWIAHSCSSCSLSQYTDHNNSVSLNGKQYTSSNNTTTVSSSHTYTWFIKATTTSMKFYIVDSNYADNTGSLTLNMYVNALPTTATNTQTPTVTNAPTGSPTPTGPQTTKFNLDLLLHGIGNAGDAANPNGGGNTNLVHLQRPIRVEVLDATNQVVKDEEGVVVYNSGSGSFKGTVDMGTDLVGGVYTVKVKFLQSLKTLIPGIQVITAGTTHNLPQTTLVNGDVNNDNVLNIIDYDILLGCYSDFLPAENCTPDTKLQSDITDDGSVNQFDYNLFLRELSNQGGQ